MSVSEKQLPSSSSAKSTERSARRGDQSDTLKRWRLHRKLNETTLSIKEERYFWCMKDKTTLFEKIAFLRNLLKYHSSFVLSFPLVCSKEIKHKTTTSRANGHVVAAPIRSWWCCAAVEGHMATRRGWGTHGHSAQKQNFEDDASSKRQRLLHASEKIIVRRRRSVISASPTARTSRPRTWTPSRDLWAARARNLPGSRPTFDLCTRASPSGRFGTASSSGTCSHYIAELCRLRMETNAHMTKQGRVSLKENQNALSAVFGKSSTLC